jgi:hypothetical protein
MNGSTDAALQVVNQVCGLLSPISSHLPPQDLCALQANLLREQLAAWPKINAYGITEAIEQHVQALQSLQSTEQVLLDSKWLSCAAQCMFLIALHSESVSTSLQCWNIIKTAILPVAAFNLAAAQHMLHSLLAMQELQCMAAAESASLIHAAVADLSSNSTTTTTAAAPERCTLLCGLISNQLLQTAHTDDVRHAVLHLALQWLSCKEAHYINCALRVLPGVFADWHDATALTAVWQLCCTSNDMDVSLAVLCLLFESLCTLAQPIPMQQQLWQLIHAGLATGNTLNSKRALHLLHVTLAWLNSNSSTAVDKHSANDTMILWKQYALAIDTLQTEIAENLIDQVWPTVQRLCLQAHNNARTTITTTTADTTATGTAGSSSSTATAASSNIPSPLEFRWLSLLIETGISAEFCTRNGRRKRLETVLSGDVQLSFYTAKESYQWISAVFLRVFEHKATAAWFKHKPTESNLCAMLTQWLVSVHAEAQSDYDKHALFRSVLAAIDQAVITVPAEIDAVLTAYSSSSNCSSSSSSSSSSAAPLLCSSNMLLLISVVNKVMFWWRETHAASATLSSGDLTTVVLQLLVLHTDYTDTDILETGFSLIQCLPTAAVAQCKQLLRRWLLRIATAAVKSDNNITDDTDNDNDSSGVAAAQMWLQDMIAHKIRAFMTMHTITTATESSNTYQHSKAQARLLCHMLTAVFDDDSNNVNRTDNSLANDKQQLLQLCQVLVPVTACLSMCYSRAYMNPELIQQALVLFCQLLQHAATVTTAQRFLLLPLQNCFAEVASYVSAAVVALLTGDVTVESLTDSSGNSYTQSVLLDTLHCLYIVIQSDACGEVKHSIIAALNSTQLCCTCAHVITGSATVSDISMHKQLAALQMLHCILLHACSSSSDSDVLQLDLTVLQQLLETLVQANTGGSSSNIHTTSSSNSSTVRQYHELQWQCLALLLQYYSTIHNDTTDAAQTHTQNYLDSILTRLINSLDSVIEVNLPSAIQCIGIVSNSLCKNSRINSSNSSDDVTVSIEQAVLAVCKVLYQAKSRSHKLVHTVSAIVIYQQF